MQELVGLAHRGNNIMDPHKSWLPLLQCLLKLNSHGQPCSLLCYKLFTYIFIFLPYAHFTELHILNISFALVEISYEDLSFKPPIRILTRNSF